MSGVRTYICDALHVIVTCQVFPHFTKYFFFSWSKKKSHFQALIPLTFPRMGHLIKNGIRGFRYHDYFLGGNSQALRGRLSTSADTIIPSMTCTQSAGSHYIQTYWLGFPPCLLISIFTASHLSPFHAALAPVKPSVRHVSIASSKTERGYDNSSQYAGFTPTAYPLLYCK